MLRSVPEGLATHSTHSTYKEPVVRGVLRTDPLHGTYEALQELSIVRVRLEVDESLDDGDAV